MLNKVKKLSNKLFSGEKGEAGGDGQDGQDGMRVASYKKGSIKMMTSFSQIAEASGSTGPSSGEPAPRKSNGMFGVSFPKRSSTGPRGSVEIPAATIAEGPTSPSTAKSPGGGAVAPVHVNGKGGPPPAIANLLGSTTASPGGSGRRKSTPAALDMMLRTAEGKTAIEDLINQAQGKQKTMMFSNYFAQPGSPAAAAAAHKSSTAAAAAGQKSGLSRTAAAGAVKAHVHEIDTHGMTTVMEDEASPHTAHRAMGSSASQTERKAGGLAASPSMAKKADALSSVEHPGVQRVGSDKQRTHSPQRAPGASASPVPPAAAAPASAPVASPRPKTGVAAPVPPPQEEQKRIKLLSVSPNLPNSMARKSWSLSDYSVVRKMYTGYASTVYQATCKRSLEQVALKVYHMENLCELNHYQVFREIRVHSSLQHQNIIHLFASFQEGTDVVLVQEYAEGGDLYRLLHKNGGRLSERQAVEMVLHPFLLALHYLHTRGIMHRDIKPENVLFTEHRVLKLADFGLAIDLNEERAVTRAGTLDYMAPEVLRCPPKNLPQENKGNVNLHYNNSVDAWAVGVFAYELIVGFPPFAGETQLDSVDKIMHSTPDFPEKITELAKAFICQALKKHPGDRPTVIEMLHHSWIRSYQRRASVLHVPTSVARRRSSNVTLYGPTVAGGTPAPLAHNPTPQDFGPADDDTNPEDMSPEQIEQLIQRLQFAKQAAIQRASNGTGSMGGAPKKTSQGA